MKKIVLAICLFLSVFLFCGCSTAEVLLKENADGSLDIYYVVDLKTETLVADGTITNEDVVKMKSAVETESAELIAKSKSEFRFALTKSFADGKITEAEKTSIFNELEVYTGWTDGVYAVRYNFKTQKAYMIYSNYGKDVETFTSSEKSFFTTKYSEKSLNPFGRKRDIFGGKSAFEYFKGKMENYLTANFSDEQIAKFPKFTITYSYLSLNSRLHSDADQVVKTTSGTVHSWVIDEENSGKLIEFYTLSANRVVWYILALTICFTFTAIYLIVIYFKKDKKVEEERID